MKIYLAGNIDNYSDEAQKNITKKLSSELAKRHEVRYENAKENIYTVIFWKELSKFKPDIIHIFLRSTLLVLLYAKFIRLFAGDAKIVISALQPPQIPFGLPGIIKALKPDLFLTVSNALNDNLRRSGCRSVVLPCGVDTHKFVLVDREKKHELRTKYRVPSDKYVVLHVGHATIGRNLTILNHLSDKDVQVIFVSSKSFNVEKKLIAELRLSGCLILSDYIEKIEELYQLADCYVFPTINESNSIGLPLSVLEAMACNIPVIATRFGALPELFKESESFLFFDGCSKDLNIKIQQIIRSTEIISNRDLVLDLDWEKAVIKLEDIYQTLLSGKP